MRDVQTLLEGVDAIRAKIDSFRPYTPGIARRIQDWYVPRYIYCSGALGEKNPITGSETAAFLEREIVTGGHPIARFNEIARHRDALEYVEERAQQGDLVDVELVREVHRRLTEQSRSADELRPGEWKDEASPPARRRGHEFRFAPPERVDELMSQLVGGFTDEQHGHPLMAVAWFYFHFHLIHPFTRHNGKVARLVTTAVLLNRGYPPLIIPPGEIGAYMDALAAVDRTVPPDMREPLSDRYELRPLLEFLCEILTRTGERLLTILEGKVLTSQVFSRRVLESQEELASQFLARKDMSWRVRATFEIRNLHERLERLCEKVAVDGPIYNIRMTRADIVPGHAATRYLGTVLPSGDAGLLGEIELEIRGSETMKGLRFPEARRLLMAIAGTSYGIQLIFSWDQQEEPEVHHGPNRAPEWPSSTLDQILTEVIDRGRREFEAEIHTLNASGSGRYRLLREQLRAGADKQTADPDLRALAAAQLWARQDKAKAEEPLSPRQQGDEHGSLDGLRPAEPPLSF